jgi:hypothetical protein
VTTRQGRAARKVILLYAAIGVLVVSLVVSMLSLHGASFFTFRQSGTGQTGDEAPVESQGPGQPDQPVTVYYLNHGKWTAFHTTLSREPACQK